MLGTIQTSLEGSLGSDYVVQPVAQNSSATFSDKLPERISDISGVEKTTALSSTFLREGEEVSFVFGVDKSYPDIFRLRTTPPEARTPLQATERLRPRRQQLAESRKLKVGEKIELPTPDGPKKYPVAGVLESDMLGGGGGIYLSDGILASRLQREVRRVPRHQSHSGFGPGGIGRRDAGGPQELPAIPRSTPMPSGKSRSRTTSTASTSFSYAIMGVSVAVSAIRGRQHPVHERLRADPGNRDSKGPSAPPGYKSDGSS